MEMETEPLLDIQNLKARFRTRRGWVRAVDGVSFSMRRGEIVGIVGESGCGKSVTAQSILRLPEHSDPIEYEGAIVFEGQNLLALPLKDMRRVRGEKISIVFQDPLASLNPVYTLGSQIQEALRVRGEFSSAAAKERAIELLEKVGISDPEKRYYAYPHELSGGMRQRGMIAIALARKPLLLIADEPTTALDTTIQAQILELIGDLNRGNNMAVLLISHDLGLVAGFCDSVRVMYLGQIVEEAPSSRILSEPLHPYTGGLIKSIPGMEGERKETLYVIPGSVPSLDEIPRGCRFAGRCEFAEGQCVSREPPLEPVSGGRRVRCWRYVDTRHG
jgi:oligopeptide/dipeptide ABC transporter ATP-binding protein